MTGDSESVSLVPGRRKPALQGAGSPACLQRTDARAVFFFLLFLSPCTASLTKLWLPLN